MPHRLPADRSPILPRAPFCQASVKAVKADKAVNFLAIAPHVKVEAAGGIKYTRLQEVQCPSCQTPFYLWSPTLKLNASEVKAKADWLVKYLARTCNETGHANLIIMPDPTTTLRRIPLG